MNESTQKMPRTIARARLVSGEARRGEARRGDRWKRSVRASRMRLRRVASRRVASTCDTKKKPGRETKSSSPKFMFEGETREGIIKKLVIIDQIQNPLLCLQDTHHLNPKIITNALAGCDGVAKSMGIYLRRRLLGEF